MSYVIGGAAAENTEITDKTDRILCNKYFINEKTDGSFFGCVYNGELRIHAVVNDDTDLYSNEAAALIRQSMRDSGIYKGIIWLRKTGVKLTAHIGAEFGLTPVNDDFIYYMTDFEIRRGNFNKTFHCPHTDVRPFEPARGDDYMKLLQDALAFFMPPYDFTINKETEINAIIKCGGGFRTFWKDGSLLGLYIADGAYIDTIAVSPAFQGKGYGTQILTYAVTAVFADNPSADAVSLDAVEWNATAMNFYKKYGMEVRGRRAVPY
jgi:ribosomal protein S18 acetylase RimI-like enzyme